MKQKSSRNSCNGRVHNASKILSMQTQPMMFKIVPSGDYLQVLCAKCRETCQLDFVGFDPAIPVVEITCPNCGSSGKWKLDRAGMGFYKNAKVRRKNRKLDWITEWVESRRPRKQAQ